MNSPTKKQPCQGHVQGPATSFAAFIDLVLQPGPLRESGITIDVRRIPALLAKSGDIAREHFSAIDEDLDPELWKLERACGLHKGA